MCRHGVVQGLQERQRCALTPTNNTERSDALEESNVT